MSKERAAWEAKTSEELAEYLEGVILAIKASEGLISHPSGSLIRDAIVKRLRDQGKPQSASQHMQYEFPMAILWDANYNADGQSKFATDAVDKKLFRGWIFAQVMSVFGPERAESYCNELMENISKTQLLRRPLVGRDGWIIISSPSTFSLVIRGRLPEKSSVFGNPPYHNGGYAGDDREWALVMSNGELKRVGHLSPEFPLVRQPTRNEEEWSSLSLGNPAFALNEIPRTSMYARDGGRVSMTLNLLPGYCDGTKTLEDALAPYAQLREWPIPWTLAVEVIKKKLAHPEAMYRMVDYYLVVVMRDNTYENPLSIYNVSKQLHNQGN